MDLLYFSWPEYNTWCEGAFAAVCTVTKRRNFRASHTRLRNISIFFSKEVAKFPIWMSISLWSHSAWTWLADFRHLAARKNACAISYTFPTMIPELFLNRGYQHSHAFSLTSYCSSCGLVCFSPHTSGECFLVHAILLTWVWGRTRFHVILI